ncbi:MAG: acyl-CoA/acyl-ACP dehydrogenase [Actinomycetota bacterium]|jgi:acyl-CoA dehydrogenase|nr:acyl-CoA/acyl-ACP dehydrogenase [Actinomycetota bacterium]
MDFTLTEAQEAVRQAAAAVFDGSATPERVREVEATPERFDRVLWDQLARADLLGVAVPARHGGGGLGMVELALVLAAQGRCVAPVPLWATAVLGAQPLDRFGSDTLAGELLAGVADGTVVLTAALADVAADCAAGGPGRPAVRAERTGSGVRLTGRALAVPAAHVADAVLVPAALGDGVVVGVVDPTGPGVRLERAETTDRGVHPHLHLDDVFVDAERLLAEGDPGRGAEVLAWALDRARVGLSALQLGVAEGALARTAAYLNERVQFGRPLATFQGVKLRAADAAIGTDVLRVTMLQAAWRLDAGLDARRAVSVAAWFARDTGQRVVHATQHLHGGMGADVDYPVHRYFLWGKQVELLLGSPGAELAALGRQLVADVRAGALA